MFGKTFILIVQFATFMIRFKKSSAEFIYIFPRDYIQIKSSK